MATSPSSACCGSTLSRGPSAPTPPSGTISGVLLASEVITSCAVFWPAELGEKRSPTPQVLPGPNVFPAQLPLSMLKDEASGPAISTLSTCVPASALSTVTCVDSLLPTTVSGKLGASTDSVPVRPVPDSDTSTVPLLSTSASVALLAPGD